MIETPLQRLAALACANGASAIAAEAQRWSERVAGGRLYVACVGQFKRGKSTLLNALLGEALLPTGIRPVTTVVTVIRHGDSLRVRICFAGGRWQDIDPRDLSQYVSEAENPANEKGVAAAEIFHPSVLLSSGVCLVDTPGLGSIVAANTQATRTFVPQIDAALVVLGVDPPLGGEELDLIEEIAREVRDLVIVLGKADRYSDAERREARLFAESAIQQRLGRPVPRILEVSALEWLNGKDTFRDWHTMTEVLRDLGERSSGTILRGAEERGIRRVGLWLLDEIEEQRQALVRPLAESEERIERLRACCRDAERSLEDLSYLLTGVQDRLGKELGRHRQRFLDEALPDGARELHALLAKEVEAGRGAQRGRAYVLAEGIAERGIKAWFAAEEPEAQTHFAAATRRFVELANAFIERLASSGEPVLARLVPLVDSDVGLRSERRFYYKQIRWLARESVVTRVADWLLPRDTTCRVLQRDAVAYLGSLLSMNATRLLNDFEERILESRRTLESQLRDRLHGIYASAERALERASELRAAGGSAAEDAVHALDESQREVVRILEEREKAPGPGDDALAEVRR